MKRPSCRLSPGPSLLYTIIRCNPQQEVFMPPLRIATLLLFGIGRFGRRGDRLGGCGLLVHYHRCPRAVNTTAYGINDSGQIVGNYYAPPCDAHSGVCTYYGFLYSAGSFTPINVPGAFVTSAWGSTIAARSRGDSDFNSHWHGFLATPVPEPRTLPLLAGCLIGLAMALRRRRAARNG
jgi:hypothetical protein